MKSVLLTLLLLAWTWPAFAKCYTTGLSVFPTGQTLRPNSILVLEGYANSQQIIRELNRKYPIYLQSGNRKVRLLVAEVLVGQLEITQAVLRPAARLEAGREYTLLIENLPPFHPLRRYRRGKVSSWDGLIRYQVVAGRDTDKPVSKAPPREIRKTLVEYGCGPAIHVVFACQVADESEVMARTTIKDRQTGKVTTAYLLVDNNEVQVGHGMCSGAFALEQGEQYEAEFRFLDASGNLTPSTGARIRFTKPTQATSAEEEE